LGLPYLRIVVVGESGVIDPYGYWRGIREIDGPEQCPVGVHLDRPDAREDYSIEPVPITVPQAEPTTSAPVIDKPAPQQTTAEGRIRCEASLYVMRAGIRGQPLSFNSYMPTAPVVTAGDAPAWPRRSLRQ